MSTETLIEGVGYAIDEGIGLVIDGEGLAYIKKI